jgi:hypothetical protein
MYPDLDLDALRLKPEMIGELKPRKRPPRRGKGERFLCHIPWPWVCEAAKLPGRAWHVAAGIWHVAGMEGTRTVQWRPKIGTELGLNYQAFYRGLAALEVAGLIRVERHRGRSPTITILHPTEGS